MASRNVSARHVWVCLVVVAAASGCGKPSDARRGKVRTAEAAAVATACSGQQTCTPDDAHAKHQDTGLDCIACHPCGGSFGFQVGYRFPGGTTITAGDTFTPGDPPTCTVACHYPQGSPAHPVGWDAPTPLECVGCHDTQTLLQHDPDHPPVAPATPRSYCVRCHDQTSHTTGQVVLVGHPDAWMDRYDPGFHAFAATRGIAECQTCHLQDLSGGHTNVSCASCHRAGGTASDFATCTACHGGGDNDTGAPPVAIWGHAGDPARGGGLPDHTRVGAQTSHVTQGEFGPAFACQTCHVVPASIVTPGHIDTVPEGQFPVATITFSGLAVNGSATPTWNRETATCSGTYCHGATLPGGTLRDPSWTSMGLVTCGSCHAAPPPPPHVAVDTSNGYGTCNPCHSHTVDGAGHIIPGDQGGTHVNGLLEASGHDANWMDTTSPGFHAFAANRGIANCKPCHGEDLHGGSTGVGCVACHRADGPANDFASCTACHGGTASQTGAPPAAIWGYAGDPARVGGIADPIRVGGHTKHLAPALSSPFACASCHVVPADVLAPTHIDDPTPVATVTFGGLGAQVPPGPGPAWDRATAGCSSTYCHGNYAGVYVYDVYDWDSDSYVTRYFNYTGPRATPGWTSGPMACDSCHGNPPSGGYWHNASHGNQTSHRQCQNCHPDATSTAHVGEAITNPAQHVNGIVEVTPRWTSRCFNCH